jgi:hypothetical protein
VRVLLLDPGLLNRNGHHFHTDLAIYHERQARGSPITVLGNRGSRMQEQMENLGSREICPETFDSDGVASALDRLLTGWPAVIERGRRVAPAGATVPQPFEVRR